MQRWIWVDRAVNIAIGVLAVTAAVALLHRHWPHSPALRDVSVRTGTHLALDDVSWSANNLTVVFALSTQCHFCSGNAALYRRLTDALRSNHSGVTIAVLPEDLRRSREYLAELNVVPDSIRQMPIPVLGAKVTPTIIAVGTNGRVLKSWVGQLSEAQAAAAIRDISALAAQMRRCPTCAT